MTFEMIFKKERKKKITFIDVVYDFTTLPYKYINNEK